MEAFLELFGTLLVIIGVSAGVWAIATGHIYGVFKAAGENPLFALAAIAGIIFVVAGLVLGNVSLTGAVHDFETGVGWVLTIGGGLILAVLVVGVVTVNLRERKAAREVRASAQASRQPTAGDPDEPVTP